MISPSLFSSVLPDAFTGALGEDGIVLTIGGDAQDPIRGLVRLPEEETFDDGRSGAIVEGGYARLKEADAINLTEGDTLTFGGSVFKISEVKRDGYGMIDMRLTR